jgi:hypothetical protein
MCARGTLQRRQAIEIDPLSPRAHIRTTMPCICGEPGFEFPLFLGT